MLYRPSKQTRWWSGSWCCRAAETERWGQQRCSAFESANTCTTCYNIRPSNLPTHCQCCFV